MSDDKIVGRNAVSNSAPGWQPYFSDAWALRIAPWLAAIVRGYGPPHSRRYRYEVFRTADPNRFDVVSGADLATGESSPSLEEAQAGAEAAAMELLRQALLGLERAICTRLGHVPPDAGGGL